MKNQNKRELILNAMQELMATSPAQSISVSELAQKAGIGKGSIYYYFSSKNDIIEGVIERSYSRVLDEGRALAASLDIDAFQKMEIIYHACLDSSLELKRQEALNTFYEQQQSAFTHQKFARVIISKLEPILSDIIRQGIAEGTIHCDYPEETARIVLTVLTITLDNNLTPANQEQIHKILTAFARMQEDGMGISKYSLQFLYQREQEKTDSQEKKNAKE